MTSYKITITNITTYEVEASSKQEAYAKVIQKDRVPTNDDVKVLAMDSTIKTDT